MPGAYVLCTHIVLHMIGAVSAKGRRKVGEVIDLLDDGPGMASQDLQGSPLPVSPLRVRLAGLLLIAKCLQSSSSRLPSVASTHCDFALHLCNPECHVLHASCNLVQ